MIPCCKHYVHVQGASPLAAFRKEIERRVIEQLSSKMELPAPVKVDRSMGPSMPAGTVQAPLQPRQPWTEQDVSPACFRRND